MGPQPRGTTGRESRRAPPSLAPGDFLSLWGTGLATQFLWPPPPQTCSAGSHLLAPPAGRLSRAPRNLGGLPRSEGGLCRSHQSEKTIPPGS
ncbi:hypothetical protein COCOBI_06-4400 [Coccomyxa sp. Obi]|nr:hypothetical protein COCOBI_06-4400 [Coccomyxa sp. Obi]